MGTPDALGERLRGMLLAPTSAKGNNGASQQPSSSSRPLIEEVVRDGGGRPATTMTDGDEDEDDDGPPPISFRSDPAPPPRPSAEATAGATARTADGPAKPTLAEQLLAEADAARQKEKKERTERERTKANKSTFGMKKGFLNAPSGKRGDARKKKNGGGGKQAQKAAKSTSTKIDRNRGNALTRKGEESNLVYELDGEGNMVPSTASTTPDNGGTHGSNGDPLHLPEVQSAMLEHLQSQSSQWATPDLLESISQNHPNLARGMADPRYMAALQGMQSHPKETLERLQGESPEILAWLMEFYGVMGEHFTKLGEAQDGRKGGTKEEVAAVGKGAKVREVGPLEEKALRAHQSQNEETNNSQPKEASANPTEEAQLDGRVASILADDELRSMLLDPAMQRIMEECAHPGKVRYYLGHPEHGPKLRRLMDAGLIRLG